MANLVETILSALPADSGDNLAAQLGEQPDAIVKGLSAILPLVLATFAGKARSGADLGGLSALVQGALAGGNPLDDPGRLFAPAGAPGGIGGLATQLLGSGMGPVVAAVASYFGLRSGTVQQLMTLAGPLIAGGLGKALGAAPGTDAIRSLLLGQADSYERALPSELRQLVAAPAAAAAPVPPPAPAASGSSGWKWLLLGLGVLALVAWLLFGRTPERETPPATPADSAVSTAPVALIPPDGAGVIATEDQGAPVLMVFFASGASDVAEDFQGATGPIHRWLETHNDGRLSVSGFNDPTGDAAANAELAKRRAERVRDALVEAGIEPSVIDLDKPAEATDSDDTLAAARRVEVRARR